MCGDRLCRSRGHLDSLFGQESVCDALLNSSGYKRFVSSTLVRESPSVFGFTAVESRVVLFSAHLG